MKENISVLVTGANGQLGLTLQELALGTKTITWQFYNSKTLDITNKEDLKKALKGIDYCINCAAYTNVEEAEENKKAAYAVNYKGVKNLAKAVKETKTKLIHVSTDYVFDGQKESAYVEDDITNPINIYGASKLAGEDYIRKKLKTYYIIRTSWLYSKHKKNFYTTIRNKALTDDKLKITNAQTGAPTSAKDLSKAIIYLITNAKKDYGTYHFSNSGTTNWYLFAKKIIELTAIKKLKNLSEVGAFKTKAKRPDNSKLDNSKFEKTFNYKIPTWEEGLKDIEA